MTKLQASLGRKSKQVDAFAANEDSLTSARAQEFCQNLANQLGNHAKLIKKMWLFSELRLAAYPGVGATFAAQQTFAGLVYSALTVDTTLGIPGIIGKFCQANPLELSCVNAVTWLSREILNHSLMCKGLVWEFN